MAAIFTKTIIYIIFEREICMSCGKVFSITWYPLQSGSFLYLSNDIHTIFVCIDNEWYEVDMMNDNIKRYLKIR